MEVNNDDLSNLNDLQIDELYSDILESGLYLAVECGKGYTGPVCAKYGPTGNCIQYIMCN